MAGTDQKAALVAKYRTTTKFKDALKIIEPAAERRKQCEDELAATLWGIEWAHKIKFVKTPARYRRDLEKLAKTLQRAIELGPHAFPPEYQAERAYFTMAEELKNHLRETERAINWTSKRVRKGSPRQSWARIQAVDGAYLLLTKYGKRPPGISREGPWHKLAKVLFGDEADLFDYLQPRRERIQATLKAIRSKAPIVG